MRYGFKKLPGHPAYHKNCDMLVSKFSIQHTVSKISIQIEISIQHIRFRAS